MLKLIILTKEIHTERTAEQTPTFQKQNVNTIVYDICRTSKWQGISNGTPLTMFPDIAITFDALCIGQWAYTSMCTQTLPPMAHPSFTEIAHRPLRREEIHFALTLLKKEMQPSLNDVNT